MATAREVALKTLAACQRQGAWSDGYLKKAIREGELDRRDAALATRLCFGVLQQRMLLDYYLNCFSKIQTEKMEPAVLASLRLGVYQILFLDKVPDRAAVSESVDLAKKYSRNPRTAGLVNAVLRALLREKEHLPEVTGRDDTEILSIRTSHPRWLVEEFLRRLGREETERLLLADNEQPPTVAQVNVLKTDAARLLALLKEAGVEAGPHPFLPDCLYLTGTGDLEKLGPFREGLFTIQDAASRLAVLAAGPKPGDRVLDCCAAPGGKSFACAMNMENRGEIISCDIHPHKIGLIEAGRDRLGITCLKARLQNAKEPVEAWTDGFDLVLTDVPCSGLGIIRKKPDIRYKDPKPLENLPRLQAEILENCSRYVKPGGVLLYSTCTLLSRENEDVVSAFLQSHSAFRPEPFSLPGPIGSSGGMLTLWPQIHGTDGFFIAKLRRMV